MTLRSDNIRPAALELRVVDVARELGVTIGTVRRWADRGYLRSHRLPSGHRRFARSDVDALLRSMKGATTPPTEQSADRYALMVVHPDGNPTEIERNQDPAAVLRSRDRLWSRDRRYWPRRHYYVIDTDDEERGALDWDDFEDLVA